VGSFHLLRNS